MHSTSNKLLLLLALLLCLAGRGFAATALGSITITGAEQSSGGTWDTGTVTATINGVSVSFAYGQFSTPASIASALGALISQKCGSQVYAKANGATLTLYQKGSNSISSASITSTSSNPSLFSGNSFLVGGGGSWSSPQIALSLSEGPPGMGFIITGTGIGNASNTVVFLGTTQLTPIIWGTPSGISCTQGQSCITVQVPPGAVSGSVTVKVNGYPSNSVSFTADTPYQCN